MFNKPRGCISACSDVRHSTVMDHFPEELRADIFPVGRLDKDTEGLLIMTDDGSLAHRLMSPEFEVEKRYFFIALGTLCEESVARIESGIRIYKGSDFVTSPARLEIVGTAELSEVSEYLSDIDKKLLKRRSPKPTVSGYVTVTEGKKHQVRRMLGGVGCRVLYLRRVSVGGVSLDPSLSVGEYRELTSAELLKLI